MDENKQNRSIEDASNAFVDALNKKVPQDASLWSMVQYSREAIRDKRILGVPWAEVAAAAREAGYPQATESNVRLAFQASAPLKKVAKARRRRVINQQSPTSDASPRASDAARKLFGAAPRTLKDRYGDK